VYNTQFVNALGFMVTMNKRHWKQVDRDPNVTCHTRLTISSRITNQPTKPIIRGFSCKWI